MPDFDGDDGDQVVHAPHVRVDREALLFRRDGQGPARLRLHAPGPVRGRPPALARRHGRQRTGKKKRNILVETRSKPFPRKPLELEGFPNLGSVTPRGVNRPTSLQIFLLVGS